MPKVSVIIPAYNAMTYLPETLESVMAQTFTDFEVLIINDGSSDHIVEWASRLVEARVKLISQENQGSAGARNTGIAHSQGKYIAFLDADDLWEPTKLEKQVHCLDENPEVGLVNTWVVNADEQGNPTNNVLTSNDEGDVWKQIAVENLIFCGSAPMVRRCCFETLGEFDQSLRSAEDWDMWIRIASRYSFAVVKESLVFYRQRPTSKSNNLQFHIQHRLKVIDKTFQSVPKELLYLKGQAYGRAYLSVAWKPLLNSDYKTALYFRQQALVYYPQLRYTEGYIRLGLIVAGRRWLGTQGYRRGLALIGFMRKQRNLLKQWILS
ncbi:MAG: glycosyltransferase family 2 protein [Coleofasciculus sp. S288]|nr:glycosyltransferase family 2 protein [Coleofasciculus sp. S288]